MSNFFRSFPRHIRNAFFSLFRHFAMSLSACSAVTVTLILFGVFLIIAGNVSLFATNIEDDVRIHVVLESSVTKDDDIEKVVGLGAGLTNEAYENKVRIIKEAIKKHKPNKNDVLDILAKVGGFDICAMIGVFIVCAYNNIPIVVDGFISIVACLCAIRLNKNIKDYVFLSHKSMEKGYLLALEEINLPVYLDLKMRLGEGSGCPLMFSIIDGAVAMFKNMATFEEAKIDTSYLQKLK